MKNTDFAIKVLYSAMFAGLLACSAAPTVQKTRTTTAQTADASGSALPGTQTPTSADTKETPAPEVVSTPTPPAATPPAPTVLALGSTAFANMTAIPATYVAKNGGGNMSPPLEWKNAPAGTGSFVIQMVDLDFQTPPFIHWLITNIPAGSTKLPAAVPAGNNLAAPADALGANQPKAYAGPNPPNLHRYEWTVYAIKAGETPVLGTNSATNKTELEAKSLGKATLIGTYQ